MRLTRGGWMVALALIGLASIAEAQITTGTIRGQVVDPQGLAVPGATVTATSPNLQGARTAVTSDHGDYLLAQLPPGRYEVTFELSGFEPVRHHVTLAQTQLLPLDASFQITGTSEIVDVVGTAGSNALARTSQAATRLSQSLIRELPTSRDISSALLLAPNVHQSGPNGAYTINGAVSFENLFTVNGAPINENLRGTPHDLYIEDAIQETTVAAAGVSAEYGRFTGGVVNLVTKSGGNRFSGSFRDTLLNEKWRAFAPSERYGVSHGQVDPRVDRTVPTYEFTVGGPVMKDRLWFFVAGRNQTTEASRELVGTNIPYVYANETRRLEGNATYSPAAGHRFQGVYMESGSFQRNATQSTTTSMDLNSLFDARQRMDLSTISYTGVISPRLFLEGRVSIRNETLSDYGARTTDRIEGTLLVDRVAGRRYWAPTFCGVCGPEQRDSQDFFAKGSYFLSTERYGSHEVVFGVDSYNDSRFANNHQSGSDYRVVNTMTYIAPDKTIYPRIINDGTTAIQWQPIFEESQGSNFRTHSLFFNDNWRVSNRLTANLGLRYDRNHGTNGVGALIANDAAWSPRVGFVFTPDAAQQWAVSGSVAQYVASVANTVADASSPGGNADGYQFRYDGPSINATVANPVSTRDALRQVFDWFDQASQSNSLFLTAAQVRGVTPQFRDSLKSPNALEYAAGLSRQLGARASVRADFTYRTFRDFYAQRTDSTTGRVTDTRPYAPSVVAGRPYDLVVIENTNALQRRYVGGTFQGQYRPNGRTEIGANYTLSRLWGNADGENVNAGPIASDILQYPEYKQQSWNAPIGDLSADQRHRARAWLLFGIPRVNSLSLGIVQLLESGVPYGAMITNYNPSSIVANTVGYATPPTSVTYYLTARDAFRTAGQTRTDASLNFAHRMRSSFEVFGQFQVINLFNHYQACGCAAANVFGNGGQIVVGRVDQAVRMIQPGFDFRTTTPQQGVHWDWQNGTPGNPTSRFGWTTPRTLRLSFGVRF